MNISKNEGIKKDDNDKHKQYQKQRYSLFIFQKTEKNSVLNIHSISNCSDHLFSVSYGYLLKFMFDFIFPRIFW